MRHSSRKEIRGFLCFLMTMIMILTSMPVHSLAANVNHNDLSESKSEIINNITPVKVAKPETGKMAADLIKNPDQPKIYTLRTDYKVQRGEKYYIDYQPYIASVGAAATKAEKDKVKKTMDLPALAGYDEPQDDFTIDYNTIVNKAKEGTESKDSNNGDRYSNKQDFKYTAKSNKITIKHVFQNLEDFTKYTNPNGSVEEKDVLITTQNGNTGSTMEVSPLGEGHPKRKGFVPEVDHITMQVPENDKDFILEYRYKRASYDVIYDTAGGTELPARTLYYGQVMPKIADEDVPTKVGGEFQGWKPSVDLSTKDGQTFKADEIIKVGTSAIKNLDAKLIMPASKVTFTAVWKDKEKADYAVQFWAEKADHADGASLGDKYDYIGTRVYKDQATGSRPVLDNVSVDKIVFPDLDKARLNKIWAGARFNRGHDLYLNKFYVYNKDLTHDQNKDPKNVNLVKSVDSTGKTVYNIYYDRQVYDLYFTKSNVSGDPFYPKISKDGKEVGKEGNPYHFKARFNQSMVGLWPDDVKEVRGFGVDKFDVGKYSLGWLPNLKKPKHFFRDTPPYRLSANLFIDFPGLEEQMGYVSEIDIGNGQTKPASITDLSFGIDQATQTMPHHIDFWLDDFDGEQVIDYDLYTIKSDVDNSNYHDFLPPDLQGFTPKTTGGRGSEFKDKYDLENFNDDREEITPFPEVYSKELDEDGEPKQKGKLYFMKNFPGDEDREFEQNGYLKFEYSRNKYPLRFNYDPSIIRDDSYFKSTNSLDTFYEFPLKVLSPDLVPDDTERKDREYFKEDPKNFIDNPENLQALGLTDLVFTDPKDGKLKVKRPKGLSDQMVFKGWALDPAGTKLIWEKPGEKMPNHAVNLYAKWEELDYKWKVTFDPNGGSLRNIKEGDLTTSSKKIQEGDIGQEQINTYAKKEKNDGDKQVFTVIQRQKLVEPKYKPTRKGYDFMGWEVIHYKKDANTGDYKDEIDNSYRETYKVPELYSFGNDVVAPVYLKAIWVPNDRVDVKVVHHILSLDLSKETKTITETLHGKRAGYLVATTGDKQDDKYILATHEELNEKLKDDLKELYEEYNKRVGADNTFFQQFRVEPEKKLNPAAGKVEENPDVKNNVFHFFYKPFRTRQYKVNYIDERFKGKQNEKDGAIIDQELVENGNRHYDARNYRPIPGWVLAKDEKPQQQLFFDVNEKTNEFIGINGTKSDEITFYYKDVRVIEVPKDGVTPEGYVRVTFKADQGGSFGKDKDGNPITELNYDVIKGLKSDLLPVPKELAEGETADKDKYYITPETGRKFIKWDKSPLLNKNTIINEAHTFTAYFEWSGLSASGLIRTEAFKDSKGTWTNNFAPTIEDLKKQLVWREKDVEKPLPKGTEIKLYDEAGTELTTDEQVYNLVNEKKAADKDQLVRTVKVKARVTFKDGKEPQELDIPIKVYKNVYEALNKEGDKPLFLKEAEGKDAKDGGLKDVTGDYVKVTVAPTGDMKSKDNKVYYVNPKAWVEIPEVKPDGSSTFINWTANKDAQNENGKFDFAKRHKFTEDTIITPVGAGDVVEQEKGKDKPDVPKTYVKVIVKTTDKATSETAFEKTFWVNPTKEVTIPVTEPTGKTDQEVEIPKLGKKKVNYVFKEWQKVQTGQADDKLTEVKPAVKIDLAKNKFADKVTVIEAVYNERFAATPIAKPIKTEELHTPEGKKITDKDLIDKITPPENKEIESITVVERPDPSKPGKQEAKVIVKYKDGSTQGTDKDPVVIPVEVHKNIIPEAPGGQRPKDALDNYVKVIFKAGEGGKLDKTLTGNFVYYVSPEVTVDMTAEAGKIIKTPDTGYIVNGGEWKNKDNKDLKGSFTEDETVFEYNFKKSTDIVEKTDDSVKKPDGYVRVIFRADAHGKLEGNKTEKIYYVNPKAEIKLVELADGKTAGEKQLAVPKTVADENYVFEKWYEAIDKNNSVTNNLEYVARFVKDGVTLTYDANGAEGTVPEAVTVAQGTSVRLASAAGLTKKDAKFAGWKLDGEDKIYKPGDQVKLEKARTATAQWTNDKNIIPYDPNEPITRPEGYVRVTFAAEKGLSLTKSKAYYVKANAKVKLSEIKLDETKYGYPKYIEETGYKFKDWDKKEDTVINTDILVTAKATKLDNVIPEKDGKGNPNTKPDGYKEVTFVIKTDDATKGSIDGVAKFYVNPNEYVTINPPTTKANTGYKFGAWDKNATIPTVYKEDATITGSFNGLKDIIPKTNPDGSENTKPDGYKTVTFVIDPATGGKIADKEVTVYYVNPDKEVTVSQPKTAADTGYEFDKWDQDTTTAKKYTEDTTVKGNFKKLKDIIPSTDENGKSNAQPEGYQTVTFVKGDHGTEIKGQTVYYVNPNADPAKTLGDKLIVKPTVTPETGYKFTGWNFADTKAIKSNITVTAQYESIADVVPKDNPKGGENDKPEGYITVTFSTEANGKIKDTADVKKKVVYVNPNKAVALKGFDPEVTPNTGFDFADWDTQISKKIQYSDGDTIKALYNAKDDVIPQKDPEGKDKPAGYFTVTFDKGEHGELRGKTVYYVKPNKKVTVPAPTVNANMGYEFSKWDSELTQTFTKDTTITAKYATIANIIPGDQTKPDGYVTVTFVADENGSLIGTTVYYVKPNVVVNLTDKANDITKTANVGYTADGGAWVNDKSKKIIDTFEKDVTFKFTFKKLDDVIPAGDKIVQPNGYVKVEFTSDANGSLEGGDKTYYVNPLKKVKVGSENLQIPTPKPNENYTFDKWLENIDQSEVITTDKKYVATFKINKVTMTYKADDKTSGTVPKKLSYDVGTEITLAGGNDLKKDNFALEGWKIKDTIYKPGATFTINENTTATAVWSADTHTVEFNTDGGTYIPSQKVKHNELITQVKNPEKPNYTFIGWKVDGQDFDPKTEKITKDITLVAQYVKDVIPQTGTEKPKDAPNNYVQVKFVPTDKATDSTDQIFWVNPDKEVTIPVANPTGKQHFTFKEWKIGEKADGDVYTPSTAKKFTEATTITATYDEAKNIIPYNPSEPITKPEGYVRVTFEADTGLKLTEQKAYYVKANAGIKLGNAELVKPEYSEDTGYKFDKWDKQDNLVIEATDIVVTAKATKLGNVIPEKDENGNKNAKPEGYKEVVFKVKDADATKGTLEGVVKFFVNPKEYVTINPPSTSANTGFEFGAWDKDATIPTVYDKDTTITGSFNGLKDLVPKTKDDDSEKPEGYVTVTFKIEGQGGSVVKDEVTVYYVNPAKDVTVPQPKTKAETGYEFDKWDQDTVTKAKKYTEDTTVTGNFKKLEDIIPSTDENGKPNAQPEGYVTVTFDKGAKGNLTGQTVYYVNPKAGKTLADITKPTLTPETGYKFKSWDTEDTFLIKADKTVTAQYDKLTDVIPKTKDDDSEKPEGYITVTFDTTEKGKIKDSTAKTKVVFVNPNKALVLKGFAPEVVANKGYEFERWDASIEKPIQYNDGDTIKAIYKPGDKPGDKPGNKPGTTPAQPGGTTPGKPEKHGHRYIERVAGKNRVHTAINTSRRFFKKSRYVIIADSGNYPDALTATVLAHVLDAPILLNNTRYLEDDVAREIVRLGASEVIIVGGHKSISENVKSQLAKYDQNKVQRIWGRDRYVTSSELAYEIQRLTGKVNKAIIASGENFPDALATAPLGSKEIAPILLVKRNQMDMKVSKALKDLNIKRVYVAGGQNSVSKKLEAQLPQVIRRFNGQDRYETAILVASYTYPDSKEVFVASGEVFPDALVIGPVCARRKAPILLSKSTPVKVTDDYIEKSKIEYLYIIGGTNTIYAETAHKYAIED